MKSRLYIYLLSSLLVLGLQSFARADEKKIPETIKGSGCVSMGTEGGCLIVTDTKSNEAYNLFFASKKKPGIGEAISFEGKKHDGPTTCMQGTPVDVTKWKKINLVCAASQ